VLVVCTANRCRSPLAAAMLRGVLAERATPCEVEAVGLQEPGFPATGETVTVASRRGLDLTDHRSRRLEPALVADADLVLGLERVHVREVVLVAPEAWPRTFTLKELVRRGETIGARNPREPLSAWLARAHQGRQRRDLLGASPLDDVGDPTGSPVGDHEDTARELEDLVGRLVELAWLPAPDPR
jgi:protein-tyrosine phosphatase